MNLDVVCFGSAGFDIYINGKDLKPKLAARDNLLELKSDTTYPIDHCVYEAGGSGLNAAIVFSRQGIKTGLVARTGKDHLGNQVKIIAKHEGIEPEMLISNAEHHTDMNIRIVTGRNHEIDMAYQNSSNSLRAKDIKYPGLRTKMIYLAELPADFKIYRLLANWSELNDVDFVVNLSDLKNYRKKQINYVVSSSSKLLLTTKIAQELFGGSDEPNSIIQSLIDMNAKSILLYDAMNESCFYQDGKLYKDGPYKKANPLDITGTNDVFAAGFVAANFLGKDIAQSMTMASAMANSVMSVLGVRTAILTKPSLRTMKIKNEELK